MNALPSRWSGAVAGVLRARYSATIELGPVQWNIRADGTRPELVATIDEPWLVMEIKQPTPHGENDPLALAVENTGLPPLLKRNCSLRAEIPLTDPLRLPEVLSCLLTSLGDGVANDALAVANNHGEAVATDDTNAGLVRLCEETAWPAIRRKDGSLAIKLDCRRGHYQAEGSESDHTIWLKVPLFDAEDATRSGARAAARMLCAVADGTHLARPYAENVDSAPTLGLEVLLHAPAHKGELAAALSALSVATDMCGPELQLLGDDDFANAYLAFVGNPGAHRPHFETTTESKHNDNAE